MLDEIQTLLYSKYIFINKKAQGKPKVQNIKYSGNSRRDSSQWCRSVVTTPVEVPDERTIQDVPHRNPAPLFGTVHLPVDKALERPPTMQ